VIIHVQRKAKDIKDERVNGRANGRVNGRVDGKTIVDGTTVMNIQNGPAKAIKVVKLIRAMIV
jgi:hypothetical protein